ncbi:hypothetical protein G4V62_12295 [Bacillaceae bacterium SIJ1]|uniref:hypothetical protein n=1 Tax=Litoribacterium kuwaitense TaxID=1398745 RepID=UPI0013EBEDCA|nr:hypothetical protein [Litoribacterium kuwaitense]NGP45697.1 hypothetical protein [Litoribacterium kuwaitense]
METSFQQQNYGYFEENMIICVESYIGEMSGKEGVKLEEQVVITKDGCERISSLESLIIQGYK